MQIELVLLVAGRRRPKLERIQFAPLQKIRSPLISILKEMPGPASSLKGSSTMRDSRSPNARAALISNLPADWSDGIIVERLRAIAIGPPERRLGMVMLSIRLVGVSRDRRSICAPCPRNGQRDLVAGLFCRAADLKAEIHLPEQKG